MKHKDHTWEKRIRKKELSGKFYPSERGLLPRWRRMRWSRQRRDRSTRGRADKLMLPPTSNTIPWLTRKLPSRTLDGKDTDVIYEERTIKQKTNQKLCPKQGRSRVLSEESSQSVSVYFGLGRNLYSSYPISSKGLSTMHAQTCHGQVAHKIVMLCNSIVLRSPSSLNNWTKERTNEWRWWYIYIVRQNYIKTIYSQNINHMRKDALKLFAIVFNTKTKISTGKKWSSESFIFKAGGISHAMWVQRDLLVAVLFFKF